MVRNAYTETTMSRLWCTLNYFRSNIRFLIVNEFFICEFWMTRYNALQKKTLMMTASSQIIVTILLGGNKNNKMFKFCYKSYPVLRIVSSYPQPHQENFSPRLSIPPQSEELPEQSVPFLRFWTGTRHIKKNPIIKK